MVVILFECFLRTMAENPIDAGDAPYVRVLYERRGEYFRLLWDNRHLSEREYIQGDSGGVPSFSKYAIHSLTHMLMLMNDHL